MAPDPRPHGVSQLGVRDPGRRPVARTRGGAVMKQRLSVIVLIATALLWALAMPPAEAARPEGTLTVAVATFGNERWLPHLYVGAEDIVLKPLWENLLNRDAKGNLIPMLAE